MDGRQKLFSISDVLGLKKHMAVLVLDGWVYHLERASLRRGDPDFAELYGARCRITPVDRVDSLFKKHLETRGNFQDALSVRPLCFSAERGQRPLEDLRSDVDLHNHLLFVTEKLIPRFRQLAGKEGPRIDRALVGFNVSAVSDELIESELFRQKKGAFTGAIQDLPGLFETATGGSLFLDETAEMSPRAQAKVLRAIEERKIRRLGERKEIDIDVRLIAATHQNLLQRVEDGQFRSDLYYRLKVIELYIPPLNERPEDIQPLAEHFRDE